MGFVLLVEINCRLKLQFNRIFIKILLNCLVKDKDGKPVNDSQKIFGKNLKKYREEKGMTQEELGSVAECTPQYISEMENCKANPSLKIMDRLADELDKSTADFLKPEE